jgi:membrane protein implicated in regulation of membrane protease activity
VGGTKGELLSHNLFAYCLNNPVNMIDSDGYSGSLLTAALSIASGVVLTTFAIGAAAIAVTAGAAVAVGVVAVVGIATATVGVAQIASKFADYSDEETDKINIKENICEFMLGKEDGEKVSAAIDVGMVVVPTYFGAAKVISNPKAALTACKVASSNLPKIMKDPMTYLKILDKYNSAGSFLKGVHKLNLMDDDTYNELIPIFGPIY